MDAVLDLADRVGIVLLEVAVPDVVEDLPQGAVGLVQGAGGGAVARLDQEPLGVGDLVELLAELFLHHLIVNGLDAADILIQDADVEAPGQDALVQLLPGEVRPVRLLCLRRLCRQGRGQQRSAEEQGAQALHVFLLHQVRSFSVHTNDPIPTWAQHKASR